ncbi:MAG: class I SAM-dependent methyltransferase [Ginsengibacter sp.]
MQINNESTYNELEIFESALNWKTYFGSFIKDLNKGNILEVGAGIGGTTAVLCNGKAAKWLCLEPDENLIDIIEKKIKQGVLSSVCVSGRGTLNDLKDDSPAYDSILYIDVIEHIADDTVELRNAYKILKPGGRLIILVPAHNALYSSFDKALGHYRRYNKQMLKSILPANMLIENLYYLDSCGFFASLFNKFFFRQKRPTQKQIKFWDNFLVPISKVTDKVLRFSFGKSVLLVARKNE